MATQTVVSHDLMKHLISAAPWPVARHNPIEDDPEEIRLPIGAYGRADLIETRGTASTVLAERQQTLRLSEIYSFRNPSKIVEFLEEHRFLIPLVFEAYPQIEKQCVVSARLRDLT